MAVSFAYHGGNSGVIRYRPVYSLTDMAEHHKKLLIIADDHPRIREALEALLADFHHGTTLYTADKPDDLWALAETRLKGAAEWTLTEISTESRSAAPDSDTAHTPMMVVSLKEQGITANWFVAIQGGDDAVPADTRIRSALNQRQVVMALIQSLHLAARQPGSQEPVSVPDSPSAESLMKLGLTRRQAEVLLWLADGLTNKEIARKLDVSEWTVRRHVSAILERLEVSNRGRAALFARQLNPSD